MAVSAAVLTVVLGLATRAFLEGWIAKYLGVALWATLFFALVFGTTFNALDLPSYVAGAFLGAAIHWALVRRVAGGYVPQKVR